MSFRITITGWDALKAQATALKAFLTEFREKIYSLASQALEKIKSAAPRKTGFMVSKMSISKGAGNVLFTIKLDAKYTGFVEFGHRTPRGFGYVPGRNFVTPNYVWLIKEIGKLLKSAGSH